MREMVVRQERTGGAVMQHGVSGRPARPSGWRLLVAAVVGLLAAAACGAASTSQSNQASGPPIKIGVLDDQAPSTAVEGAEMRVNTDLAIAQVNAAGGIHGHPLQAIYADPKAQPDQAISLAQQLVQQQGVDVLV